MPPAGNPPLSKAVETALYPVGRCHFCWLVEPGPPGTLGGLEYPYSKFKSRPSANQGRGTNTYNANRIVAERGRNLSNTNAGIGWKGASHKRLPAPFRGTDNLSSTKGNITMADPGDGKSAYSPGQSAAFHRLQEARRQILEQLSQVIVGQTQVIEELLISLFSRGHCLLEGVPGLAKTLMISTLGPDAEPDVQPHPVHARPDAGRHHRHRGDRGEPHHRRARVPLPRRAAVLAT